MHKCIPVQQEACVQVTFIQIHTYTSGNFLFRSHLYKYILVRQEVFVHVTLIKINTSTIAILCQGHAQIHTYTAENLCLGHTYNNIFLYSWTFVSRSQSNKHILVYQEPCIQVTLTQIHSSTSESCVQVTLTQIHSCTSGSCIKVTLTQIHNLYIKKLMFRAHLHKYIPCRAASLCPGHTHANTYLYSW